VCVEGGGVVGIKGQGFSFRDARQASSRCSSHRVLVMMLVQRTQSACCKLSGGGGGRTLECARDDVARGEEKEEKERDDEARGRAS